MTYSVFSGTLNPAQSINLLVVTDTWFWWWCFYWFILFTLCV